MTERGHMHHSDAVSQHELLRNILDNLFAYVAVLGLDGTVREINDPPLKASNLEAKDVLGRKFWDCLWWTHDPDVQNRVRDAVERAAEGNTVRFDVHIAARNGLQPIDFMVTPLRNSGGEIIGVIPSAVDISERARADELRRESDRSMRESEQLLRLLFEENRDALLWADPETGFIINCNREAEKLLMRDKAEIVGLHQTQIHPPEDLEHAKAIFGEHASRDKAFATDMRVIRKDGTHRWVEVMGTLIGMNEKTILQGTFRDITDRKAMEQELKASETRYRETVENLYQGIYATRSGVFTFVNGGMENIFGKRREELLGQPAWNLAVPERRNEAKERFFAMAASGKYEPIELECERGDGARFIAEIRISGRSSNGEFFGMVLDATKRKSAEESRLRTMIQHSYDVIVELDRNGVMRYISPSGTRVMGYPQSANVGKSMTEVIHPDDMRALLGMFTRALGDNEPYHFECRAKHMNGEWRHLEGVGMNISPAGAEPRIIINYRDVTDRVQSQKALEESYEKLKSLDKQKKDFLASVSHELRTPLAVILGTVETLTSEKTGGISDQQRRLFEIINRNAGRLGRLFDNLLDFARSESGQLRLDLAEVDMRKPVRHAVESLTSLAKKNGKELRASLPESPITVSADADKVVQIASNLIDNAIRYAKRDIDVVLSNGAGNAILTVADDGIGIPAEHVARLFDRYFKIEDAERRGHIGLGLSIVKLLAEAHGGGVDVANSPSGGALFTVTIPLV